jgi:hypothetical protein
VGNCGQIAVVQDENFTSWTLGQFGSATGLERIADSTHPTFIRFTGGKYIAIGATGGDFKGLVIAYAETLE